MSERPRTMTAEHWRVGGKIALNVYEDDLPMFQCHHPDDATRIVSMLNAHDSSEQTIRDLRSQVARLEERLKATNAHWDNLFCVQMHSFLGLLERDHKFKMEERRKNERTTNLKVEGNLEG